jgi:uncharacterized membrane protein
MQHGMYSKARIAGHPIHPMLVHFPIALFLGGLLALLAHMGTGELFWYRVSYIAIFAGAAGAVAAAIAGSIDLFAGIPRGTPARATGLKHMALNVVALLVFVAVGILMRSSYHAHLANTLNELDVTLPLALSIGGALVLAVSGALGSKLAYKHHVGQEIDDDLTLGEQFVETTGTLPRDGRRFRNANTQRPHLS